MAKGKGTKAKITVPDFPGASDPAYQAEARAILRGLEDTLLDTKRERKDLRRDYKTSRRDTKVEKKRSLADLGRELERGLLDLRYQKQDVRTSRGRGREDFATRIASLTRNYSQLGQAQGQAMNAGGAGAASGQARAAAARRQENFQLERQPLDTSLERMEEDSAKSLERLGTQTGFLQSDVARQQRRTRKDYRHDTRLMRRDFRRDRRDIKTQRQRAIREGQITVADLLKQATWASRRQNPGGFS